MSAQAVTQACDAVKAGLKPDNKVTVKREALKQLNDVLESAPYLRVLDHNTAVLGPQDQLPVASWPALAQILLTYVSHELKGAQGKKKGPDKEMHRTFRKLVQLAEDDRRAGRRGLLVRRAAKLFGHVREVLDVVGLSSPFGQDYGAVLRSYLLPSPEYCAACSAETFQALLNVYMGAVEGRAVGASGDEEMYRLMASIQALVERFPADMATLFQTDVPAFLSAVLSSLNAVREDSRITTSALTCLNAFLLENGRDVFSYCQSNNLHGVVHPLALRVLRGRRDSKLREVVVTYLRIQLQLGAVQSEPGWLADLREWAQAEFGSGAFRWGADNRQGRLAVCKQQHAVLELAAAIWFHSSGGSGHSAPAPGEQSAGKDEGGGGGEAGDEGRPLPAAKRMRLAPLLPTLLEQALSRPVGWAPVAAQLLLSYGLALPATLYASWLAGLAEQALRLYAPYSPGSEDAPDPDAQLWVLRLMHALAAAWPAQLAAAAAGSGPVQPELQQLQPGRLREQWRMLWDAVLAFARGSSVQPASFAAALSFLAMVTQRGLAQLPPGFHRLWDLPVLSQSPTPAALDFAAAAVQSGSDAAAEGKAWQEEVLGWLKSASVAAGPCASGTAAFAAVVRVPYTQSSSSDGSAPSWLEPAAPPSLSPLTLLGLGMEAGQEEPASWQWWQADAELDGQLAGLLRGEALMRARALRVTAEAAAAACQPADSWQQATGGRAGEASAEVHELAACSLADLVEEVLRQEPSSSGMASQQGCTQLALLLGVCTVAIRVSNLVAAAAVPASAGEGQHAVPHCWTADGPLALKLQTALQQCGNMLAEGCKKIEGFTSLERHRLRLLTDALGTYQQRLQSGELAASLLACMEQVQLLFLEADTVVPGLVVTQAVGGLAAAATAATLAPAAAEAFFDDDLDIGAKATSRKAGSKSGGGAGSSSGPLSSAALVAACRQRCIELLQLMGPLQPKNGAKAAVHWLGQQAGHGGSEGQLSDEQRLGLREVLVACAEHALPHNRELGLLIADEACRRLGRGEEGIMHRFHNAHLLWAMQQLCRLARALLPCASEDGVQRTLGSVADVLDSCSELIEEAEKKARGRLTSWELRVALARTTALLLLANRSLLAEEFCEDVLAGLLADDRYPARLEAARLVQALLAGQAEGQQRVVFQRLKRRLCLHSIQINQKENVQEHEETGVIALGEMAAACATLELECLFYLCMQAHLHLVQLPLVAAAVDWVAAMLRYPHRFAYLAWHQLPLIFHWCNSGLGIREWLSIQPLVATLPEAARLDNAQAFLEGCAGPLGAALLLRRKDGEVEALAGLLKVDTGAFVRRHLDLLAGLVYPYTTGRPQDRELARAVMQQGLVGMYLPDRELDKALSMKDVFGEMVVLAREQSADGQDPPRPFFTPEAIVQAIMKLVGQPTPEAAAQVLFQRILTPDPLAGLLLKLHAHLQRARHPRHQAQALVALRTLLHLMEGQAPGPATSRYTVSILLRALRVPQLRADGCALLIDVVKRMLQTETAMPVLGAMLPAILSTLAEGIEAEEHSRTARHAAAARPAADCLLGLVKQLTVDAPRPLRPYLRAVDPLPPLPGLQQASALLARLQEDVTPAEQLCQYAQRVTAMTPALRHGALQALRRVLATQQAALFLPDSSSAAAVDGKGGHADAAPAALVARPEVAEAAWHLAALSAGLRDTELAGFAGELLALVGPLDPSVIAFDPEHPLHLGPRDASQTHVPPGGPSTSGSLGTGTASQAKTPAASGRASSSRSASRSKSGGSPVGTGSGGSSGTWVTALRLLADYLIDEDVCVIQTAQQTLRLLLATAEGQAALEQLDEAVRPYVEVFAPTPVGSGAAVDGADADDPRWKLDTDRLWQCGEQSYECWICDLAYALLLHTSNTTLATCSRMVRKKPAFAELLLPHAFADLARRDGARELSKRLGVAISRNMLPEGHRHPKAMHLLFNCLNHLRCRHLDAKMGEGGRQKGKSKAAAATPPPTLAEVEAWHRVYWLDLDYLDVAEAAIKCNAHFTALLYIEQWCEAAHGGRLQLTNSGAALPRLESMLLDVYSQVNEPDSLYAVARSYSMMSQLKRFEHEGSWDRAMVMYDLVLQNISSAGAATPASSLHAGQQQHRRPGLLGSAALGLGPDTVAAAVAEFEGVSLQAAVGGLVRSLSQLGASHLLQTFAQSPGLAGTPAAEAVAGLGQWSQLLSSTAGSSSSGAAGSNSTDGALAAAVAALESGSMQRCKQVVATARRELVGGLVTASLEGAAHVNPALVQLQMLQEVSEAWELRWPALPDLGAVGSPRRQRQRTGAAAGPSPATAATPLVDQTLLTSVARLWRSREAAAGAGKRYDLLAPLQGLRQQLMQLLGAPQQQAAALVAAAMAARKTGHYAQATSSLYKLRSLLLQQQQAALAAAGPPRATQGSGSGKPRAAAAPLPTWLQHMLAPDAGWRAQEAKLLWAQGQQDTAVALVQRLLQGMEAAEDSDPAQHAVLQCLAAKWLSHTRSDSPGRILGLMQAAADGMDDCEYMGHAQLQASACRIMFRLAHYADGLYRGIQIKKSSPEHSTAQAVLHAKKQQLVQLKAQLEERKRQGLVKIDRKTGAFADRESRLLQYHITQLQRPVDLDTQEQNLMVQNERQFLMTALNNYIRCMATGSAYDLRVVFRLVQLWLSLAADQDVNKLLASKLGGVPSHKFLPLVYQLASRMSAAKDGPLVRSGFQAALQALMVRLGREHPHHTLYQVFALKNGNRGRRGQVEPAGTDGAVMSYSVDMDKVAAAEAVLQEVKRGGRDAEEVVRQMSDLINGYIELAAMDFPKDQVVAFPAGLRRAKRHYTRLPVPSVSVPVDPSTRYEGLPTFESFGDRINFVGGVNRPKVVTASDSEGRVHRQLVKSGNDDLRQDAVMMQFFSLVNAYLGEQAETQRRRLSIGTYKVVPFTPYAGLVEWVEDTVPMGDWLLGPNRMSGAHARYRRTGDLDYSQAQMLLYEAQPKPENRRQLAQIFLDKVCARFTPVFHHFFLEHFRQPGTWFERRLAYTRSVAASSMAGYIIGLGDRHSQNILLQLSSAEVLHIDLGIAFEQGRFLNTPELVPFRLTQDVVDGMGVTGVEGLMRRCCEETLKVLRANKESILTVIEVFMHDPLYKWALTPAKANRRQQVGAEVAAGGNGGASGEAEDAGTSAGGAGGGGNVTLANVDAERTLLRIKQKLEGVEGGEGEARGVEGQVQQLLHDAMDPENLSRMYVGWGAWV